MKKSIGPSGKPWRNVFIALIAFLVWTPGILALLWAWKYVEWLNGGAGALGLLVIGGFFSVLIFFCLSELIEVEEMQTPSIVNRMK